MMHVIIRDGHMKRSVPVDAPVGNIEIDFRDGTYEVSVPREVAVEVREEPDGGRHQRSERFSR